MACRFFFFFFPGGERVVKTNTIATTCGLEYTHLSVCCTTVRDVELKQPHDLSGCVAGWVLGWASWWVDGRVGWWVWVFCVFAGRGGFAAYTN